MFRAEKRSKRNNRGLVEKDLVRRKELRIRDKNSSRAHSLKIPISNRKIYGDYELKEKIRKNDMLIEAITDAIHEYMHETLNESPKTREKKIRQMEKEN